MKQSRDYRLNLRTQRIVCAIVDDYDRRALSIADHCVRARTEKNYRRLNEIVDAVIDECCRGWGDAQKIQIRMEIGNNDGYRSSYVALSRRNYYAKKQEIRYKIAEALFLI